MERELFFLEVFENFDENFSEPHRLHRDGLVFVGHLEGHFGLWSGAVSRLVSKHQLIHDRPKKNSNMEKACHQLIHGSFLVRNLSWLNWDFLAICSILTSIVVFFLDDLGRTSFLLHRWWVQYWNPNHLSFESVWGLRIWELRHWRGKNKITRQYTGGFKTNPQEFPNRSLPPNPLNPEMQHLLPFHFGEKNFFE